MIRYTRYAVAFGITFVLAGIVGTPSALAIPILANDGVVYIEANPNPLNTTPVVDAIGGSPVSSLSVGSGQILLEDYAGSALTTYATNPSWWNAGGLAYTTTTSGMLIDFVDLFVTGFTFNIGANMNANAWIRAYYDDGAGQQLSTGWFGGIGPGLTPGYGVYVTDPAASCARITRIEVDPTFEWGIGNFGVAEGAGAGSGCVGVPEPGPVSLMGLGLLALGLGHLARVRRRGVPA